MSQDQKPKAKGLRQHLEYHTARIPILGTCTLRLFRVYKNIHYLRIQSFLSWIVTSKEVANFTYDLEELSEKYFISLVSDITAKPWSEIEKYFLEIKNDDHLKNHIRSILKKSPVKFRIDFEPKFGRRMAWYAIARAMKPRVIVETGVDRGLGACALTSALLKNKSEGFEGYYYGIDIFPGSGELVQGYLSEVGRVIIGDSLSILSEFKNKIDLLISDSDHSAEFEAKEYAVVKPIMKPGAIIVSDNSHVTDELLQFSNTEGGRFLFLQEKPKEHWYLGAGLGVCRLPA